MKMNIRDLVRQAKRTGEGGKPFRGYDIIPQVGSYPDRRVFRLLNITVYNDRMPPKIFTDGALAFMKVLDFYHLNAVSGEKLKEHLHLLLIATNICEKQGMPGSMAVRTGIQSLLINPARNDFEYGRFFRNVEIMLTAAEERMTAAEKLSVAQV
ncbi:MAG: hypothetical protein V1492_02500 [Candidatus Micrarchaeota archaeon]